MKVGSGMKSGTRCTTLEMLKTLDAPSWAYLSQIKIKLNEGSLRGRGDLGN